MRSSEHGACIVARRLWLLLALVAVPWLPAAAQQAADPAALQQALNRAQGLLRQLAEQRNRLEAENVAAQAEQARLERELARERRAGEELVARLDEAARDKSRLDRRLEGTRSRLEQVEARLQEVVDKYKALAGEHRALQAAKAGLEDTLAQTSAALDDARRRNEELYGINSEILDQYMHKGSWQDFLQREPLLGLKQVEAENFEQDMRFRNEDQRLQDDDDASRAAP